MDSYAKGENCVLFNYHFTHCTLWMLWSRDEYRSRVWAAFLTNLSNSSHWKSNIDPSLIAPQRIISFGWIQSYWTLDPKSYWIYTRMQWAVRTSFTVTCKRDLDNTLNFTSLLRYLIMNWVVNIIEGAKVILSFWQLTGQLSELLILIMPSKHVCTKDAQKRKHNIFQMSRTVGKCWVLD